MGCWLICKIGFRLIPQPSLTHSDNTPLIFLRMLPTWKFAYFFRHCYYMSTMVNVNFTQQMKHHVRFTFFSKVVPSGSEKLAVARKEFEFLLQRCAVFFLIVALLRFHKWFPYTMDNADLWGLSYTEYSNYPLLRINNFAQNLSNYRKFSTWI